MQNCLKISIFQRGIKIFGPKLLCLIFEAAYFWGFWGSNSKEKKVIPLFWRNYGLENHLSKFDGLTQKGYSMYEYVLLQ